MSLRIWMDWRDLQRLELSSIRVHLVTVNIGALIGGLIGALAVVAIVGVRIRAKRNKTNKDEIEKVEKPSSEAAVMESAIQLSPLPGVVPHAVAAAHLQQQTVQFPWKAVKQAEDGIRVYCNN